MKVKFFTYILCITLLVGLCLTQSSGAFNKISEINAAQYYAYFWSNNDQNNPRRNPDYIDFSNRGGNCAAFVSQCLNQVIPENSSWKEGTKIGPVIK